MNEPDWEDIQKKIAELRTAKTQSTFWYHQRKIVMAEQMAKAEAKGHTSAVSQEAAARRTEEYAKAVSELSEWEGRLIELQESLQFMRERIWYHRERLRGARTGL